jgi:hypothetical protein
LERGEKADRGGFEPPLVDARGGMRLREGGGVLAGALAENEEVGE